MKKKKGDILWYLSAWEEKKEPVECTAVVDETSDGFILVFHKGFNHEVWLKAKEAFFYKESAKRNAQLLRQIYRLKIKDEANKIVNDIKVKRFSKKNRRL